MTKAFYTDVFYQNNKIYVSGYNTERQKFLKTYNYEPTLYELCSEETEYKNLVGQNVRPKRFDDIKSAKNYEAFNKEVDNRSYYGFTNYVYPFIYENFKFQEYEEDLIKIVSFDIEVKSDKGFPEPELAEFPITAITIGTKRTQITLGTKKYVPKKKNHIYILCKDETDLAIKFMDVWRRLDPDIITGWNTEGFDIPYIVNRFKILVGDNFVTKLSPWGKVYEKMLYNRQWDKEYQTYEIKGVACLDYMKVYKKFTFKARESYSLNHIAYIELSESKLDYSEFESLNELYEKDHDKFIDYNIKDNELIFELEDKLGYMNQIFAIAYDSLCNYADCLTSVKLWEIRSHKHLMNKKIVMPIKNPKKKTRRILGGYVKDPVPGRYHWVSSFDFDSLYPWLFIQYNISPETMGTLRENTLYQPEKCIDMILDGYVDDETTKVLVDNDSRMVPLGLTYTNKFTGFFPEMMEELYEDRSVWKKKMLQAEQDIVNIDAEIEKRNLQA